MKNFLILALALGLTGSAFFTRPDREEFNAYLRHRHAVEADTSLGAVLGKAAKSASSRTPAIEAVDADALEFKDYYLWTVVRNKEGKSLFTGVFDHWVDNEQIRRCLPSDSNAAR